MKVEKKNPFMPKISGNTMKNNFHGAWKLKAFWKKIIRGAQKNPQCLPTILGLGFRV